MMLFSIKLNNPLMQRATTLFDVKYLRNDTKQATNRNWYVACWIVSSL